MQPILKIILFANIVFENLAQNIQKAKCDSIALSNLNPLHPDFRDVLRTVVKAQNLKFCKNLNGQDVCCKQEAIEIFQSEYTDIKTDMERRNFEVVFRINDMMVSTLRKKDLIRDLVKDLNQFLNDVDLVQQGYEDTLNDIKFSLDENEEGFAVEDRRGDTYYVDIDKIPLPSRVEDQRHYIKKYKNDIEKQLDNADNYIYDIEDFSLFDNSTFFEYKDTGNGHKLGQFNEDEVEKEFDRIQVRLRKYIAATEKCMPTLLQHIAGIKCITCDPQSSKTFELLIEGVIIQLNADKDVCVQVKADCFDYVDILDEINNSIDLYVLSEMAIKYDHIQDELSEESVENLDKFKLLIQEQQIASEVIINVLYYDRPNSCNKEEECNYICKSFLTPLSVDLNEVFQNQLFVKAYESINQFRFNITDILEQADKDREAEVNAQPSAGIEGGNAPEVPNASGSGRVLTQFISDDDSHEPMLYRYPNNIHSPRNTIEVGKQTAADTKFDGSSGITVFNMTGDATESDLMAYKVVIKNDLQYIFLYLQKKGVE